MRLRCSIQDESEEMGLKENLEEEQSDKQSKIHKKGEIGYNRFKRDRADSFSFVIVLIHLILFNILLAMQCLHSIFNRICDSQGVLGTDVERNQSAETDSLCTPIEQQREYRANILVPVQLLCNIYECQLNHLTGYILAQYH